MMTNKKLRKIGDWSYLFRFELRRQMMTNRKPPKKLVSKQRYAVLFGKTITAVALGGLLLAISAVGAVLALFLLTIGFGSTHASMTFISCGVVGVCSLALALLAVRLMQVGKSIEDVTPLTHHYTSHVPLHESLVRASDSPPIVPEAELLRAAHHEGDTSQEELVRASDTTSNE